MIGPPRTGLPSALLLAPLLLLLAACAGTPASPPGATSGTSSPGADAAPDAAAPTAPVSAPTAPRRPTGGGYYLDDGPGDNPLDAAALAAIPDAVPRDEPLHRFANGPTARSACSSCR